MDKKELNKISVKKYRDNNPEKVKESYNKWRSKNKEKRNQYLKEWNKNNPEKAEKNSCKNRWKRRGLNMDTFNYVYSIYKIEKHCHLCNKEFKNKKDKNMDHCHVTNEYRAILCRNCNLQLGKKKQQLNI